MATEQVLFALLRAEICGEPVSQEIKEALSPEMLEALFELSRRHALAHLVGQTLSKLGVLGEDEISRKFQERTMRAVTRYVRMSHEYHSICNALEQAEIPFLPLKGSVLRDWYPEPWMRTSSDIDILVKRGDEEKVANILVEVLGYCRKEKSPREISLYSPTGVHLELHYDLIEDMVHTELSEMLSGIWTVAIPVEGAVCKYEMPAAEFRFYHIAHMARHMKSGGIGIRYFLDLWIMDRNMERDKRAEEELLCQSKLTTFAGAAERLSKVWFENAEQDALTDLLEEFVLTGGTHGDLKRRLAIRQATKGSKCRALLSRIFVPYDMLKIQYPVLQRHKWLFPFYQVRRWFRLVFKDDVRRSMREIELLVNNSEEDSASAVSALSSLGLM